MTLDVPVWALVFLSVKWFFWAISMQNPFQLDEVPYFARFINEEGVHLSIWWLYWGKYMWDATGSNRMTMHPGQEWHILSLCLAPPVYANF